jgi:hypothetical protein
MQTPFLTPLSTRLVTIGLYLLSISFATRVSYAQSPLAIRNVANDAPDPTARRGIAGNNAWLGGQIGYRFGGSDSFASDLLASGLFTYDVDMGNGWHIPVISNFGGKIGPPSKIASAADGIEKQMKELAQSATGVTAGIYPYRVVHTGTHSLVTLHAQTAWRFNALRPFGAEGIAAGSDTSTLVDLHQIKVGAGIEVVLGDRKQPGLTFGVTPVGRFVLDQNAYERAFGERRSILGAVEITSILPVRADGVGLLLEGVVGGANQSTFRAGLLLAASPQ